MVSKTSAAAIASMAAMYDNHTTTPDGALRFHLDGRRTRSGTRSRNLIAFAAGVAATLAGGIVLATNAAGAAGPDDAVFVPVAPCRLFDTRAGADNVGVRSTPLAAGVAHTVQVTGASGNCNIPAGATAVSMNATGVGATAPTFVQFYPTGTERPLSSNLNVGPGQPPTPNKVDVKLSAAGQVDVFNLAGSVDVVADVVGYYAPSGVQTLEVQLAQLESELPVAFSATADSTANLGTDLTVVGQVEVSPPGLGTVIVESGAGLTSTTADSRVRCLIAANTTFFDVDHAQYWQSAGASPMLGAISGTRSFNVTTVTDRTYSLVCQRIGAGNVNVENVNLNAIWIPAP